MESLDQSDATSEAESFSPVANEKLASVVNGEDDKTNGHSKDANGHVGNLVDGWRPGLDHKVDYSGLFEFGGSLGALALMIGFPALMYYMWIGTTYYDGKLPWPAEGQSLADFMKHMGHLIYTGAFPSLRAWKIYWVYYVFEAVCYITLPGVWASTLRREQAA